MRAADDLRRRLANSFFTFFTQSPSTRPTSVLHFDYQAQIVSHTLSFRDEDGVPKFNAELLHPCITKYAETFVCAPSTWQDQTVCQISAS